MPGFFANPRADPCVIAPVGSYQSDDKRLVEILEVDASGALGEDLSNGLLVEISPIELRQRWHRIRAWSEAQMRADEQSRKDA